MMSLPTSSVVISLFLEASLQASVTAWKIFDGGVDRGGDFDGD